MRKHFFLFVIVSFLLAGSFKAQAQVDAHFSQYYAYPMWLNPALTGVIDGEYRAQVNYKRQWASITSPFNTIGASLDVYPHEGRGLGMGITVLNQAAGDGGYNYTDALLSASFRIPLDVKQFNQISIGAQGGIINRHINPNKFQFGSQYNPILGFDPAASSGESFGKTSATSIDANVGILYFNGNPYARLNPFFGAAICHLSRPHDPFIGKEDQKLPMRYDLHGGLRIKMSDNLRITPNALFIGQGNADEVAAGAYAQYSLEGYNELLLGATYRLNDAIIPYVGFSLSSFTLGLSYDVNVSSLNQASNGRGGIEISLSYISHKKVQDPRFICPRL